MDSTDIINKILCEIPSFKADLATNESYLTQLYDEDELKENPYMFSSDFASYVLVKISQLSESNNKEILRDCFELICEFLTSPEINADAELLNIIYVGILEILADEPKINDIAEKYLAGDALNLFEKYIGKIKSGEPFYS